MFGYPSDSLASCCVMSQSLSASEITQSRPTGIFCFFCPFCHTSKLKSIRVVVYYVRRVQKLSEVLLFKFPMTYYKMVHNTSINIMKLKYLKFNSTSVVGLFCWKVGHTTVLTTRTNCSICTFWPAMRAQFDVFLPVSLRTHRVIHSL